MSEDTIPMLVMASLALCSLGSYALFARVRHKRFATMAQRLGLDYMRWELMDFPTNLLDPLGSWDKAQEVFRGRVKDGIVMFFTIEQGFGRQAYQRTIVARRYDGTMPPVRHDFPIPVQTLEYGRWRVVTRVRPFLGSATMKLSTIERAVDWLG